MDVKLFKKSGTYHSEKENKDKPFTNFYVKCNDQLIPVEVKYFPVKEFNDRDPRYSSRVAVMSAFAEILPDFDKKDEENI